MEVPDSAGTLKGLCPASEEQGDMGQRKTWMFLEFSCPVTGIFAVVKDFP